jgi:hypothetical protein
MSIFKKPETITIVVVACFAVLISIADMVGALDGVGWLRSRIPVLTLLVVGALAGYLIVERATAIRAQEDILQNMVKKTIAGLSGIEVQTLDGVAAFWLYAANRIRTASSIDDLTWGWRSPSRTRAQDDAAYAEYRRQIASASTGKGENRDKVYREIMSFPDEVRVSWATIMMDRKYPNYHLRFYDFEHKGTPHLLQFYIFDRIEVLISLHSQTGSLSDSRYMTFRSTQLAEILSDYFDIVWRDAILLKDTQEIRGELLRIIAERFADS